MKAVLSKEIPRGNPELCRRARVKVDVQRRFVSSARYYWKFQADIVGVTDKSMQMQFHTKIHQGIIQFYYSSSTITNVESIDYAGTPDVNRRGTRVGQQAANAHAEAETRLVSLP